MVKEFQVTKSGALTPPNLRRTLAPADTEPELTMSHLERAEAAGNRDFSLSNSIGERAGVRCRHSQLTLEVIADVDDVGFGKIVAQFPRFVGADSNRFRSSRKLKSGLFMEANLSANAIQRLCIQVTETAGLSPEDWRVEYSI